MIKAHTPEPFGNVLMGPVSGVHNQSDTLAGRFGSSKSGTVNNGDVPQWKVGDRVGEFLDLNGYPIPAKRNANDAMGDSAMELSKEKNDSAMGDSAMELSKEKNDSAMGDSAGSKGDRAMGDSAGSKGDRVMGDSAGSRAENEVVPLSSMTQKRPQERIQVISGVGQTETIKSLASIPSWKSLFSAKTVTKSPLEFVAPEIVNGKPVIEPPTEAVVEGMMLWEDCLVGQFFDKRLPLHVVRAAIEKLWGKK